MPEININFTAILVAVIANFIFGFLWYTPIFGKLWAKEMGFDTSKKTFNALMSQGIIFMVIGNFFSHGYMLTTWPFGIPSHGDSQLLKFLQQQTP
jgi:hypothetical protein